MDKKYKVNEIFYSIQGEGYHTGQAAIFIRMSGCNLRCPFCDTDHQEGQMYTADEICQQIKEYPAHLVVITGGEPSLQIDDNLIARLHDTGHMVAVETNGTRPLPHTVDWITLSPKDIFCKNAEPVIEHAEELKVVYDGKQFRTYDKIHAKHRYIQPCDTGDALQNNSINAKTIEFVKQNPQWTISLQTQKVLRVR